MLPFRRARPAPASWNAAKTLGQIVVFWGFFLFWLPPRIALAASVLMPGDRFSSHRLIASLLFGALGLLGLVSAGTLVRLGHGTPLPLDAPRALVVRGPYRWVRNPMAVAGVGQGIALALWHGSWSVLAFFLAGGIFWHIMVRPSEEAYLLETFGGEYASYRAVTGLWIPRFRF